MEAIYKKWEKFYDEHADFENFETDDFESLAKGFALGCGSSLHDAMAFPGYCQTRGKF